MVILMIQLIFSAVSTFVLSNNANIRDSALTNLYLSLSPLTSSSSSSCTESDVFAKKSSILSVASLSLFSLAKNASSSMLIASNSRPWSAVSDLIIKKNNSSLDFSLLSLINCQIFLLFFC